MLYPAYRNHGDGQPPVNCTTENASLIKRYSTLNYMMRRDYRFVILCLWILSSLVASSCTSLSTPLPLHPTATFTPPAPTATSTATPVWFPPTATLTPLPAPTSALTPTLDVRPDYGGLIFTDDFEKAELWALGRSPVGSIALGKSELSLTPLQPRGYLYSLRSETVLSDFYLEITAAPSICRGADEYGLLIRAVSNQDFFRFGLTCRGEARLDRLVRGEASSPQPPTLSGAVPPGAPSISRLAVWASGKDIRFYVNGQYQFSVRDSLLLSGGMGVYARSVSGEAVTINFSQLSVYSVTK